MFIFKVLFAYLWSELTIIVGYIINILNKCPIALEIEPSTHYLFGLVKLPSDLLEGYVPLLIVILLVHQAMVFGNSRIFVKLWSSVALSIG